MQKAGLLLSGFWIPAWKSVRMASSAVTRQNPLANKVALVTASTDGRKQENVDRAVATLQGEGLSVTGIVCHVGKPEDRERLVATAVKLHQGVDILVSNAAVNPFFGNLMDVTEEVWNKVLSINVTAAAMLIKAVVPEMEKRGGGSVVMVGSIAGFAPFPALGPYNVSKTALLGLTKNFAAELASKNIRVNCLAPGLIKTRFSSTVRRKNLNPQTPWKDREPSKPEDCAGIVSFLCSEDASYISGETVVVGGGTPSRL
ncbi:hypothetical protein A6R68_23084 [Neotoma lepida]|uniref:Dehydrogenase/reductase SDR family member 4 n=1 Tax=Neotoma lepida TaxID=56216 RepID=A0A1A6HXK2_NEOLE|nr:hypothetical protein A6R68_23084 [Neotoma lepida]